MSVKPWVRERVIERDDGTCQWCGLVCPTDVDENHPDSATIDHIVPRSAGGSSYDANLQVLCWSCNQQKADAYGAATMKVQIGARITRRLRRALFEMVGHPKSARWLD